MRWYCVHPSLPVAAELRIRAAPDSSADECCRIAQGRAVAACSPVFQVPGGCDGAAPTSWLQVAYQDAASGEAQGGFMMAALPDGTELVTPWETTDFRGCCEVTDPEALMFDGSLATARSLGAVQNTTFLVCILEENRDRARIFHPELNSVWIEKQNLQAVCTRLKHDECSTPHTFYELSEVLPEEAQIAIREFPSKEAQTVGLLSRGETLEVTVRGGNWLKISGGRLDNAWIMWRTDALELLQAAQDVWAGTCEKREELIEPVTVTPMDEGAANTDPCEVSHTSDDRPIQSEQKALDEDGGDASLSDHLVIDTATNGDVSAVDNAAESAQDTQAWDERPIRPATDDPEADVVDIAINDDVSAVDNAAESAQDTQAWDERPIRPATDDPEAGHAGADSSATAEAYSNGLNVENEQDADLVDDRPALVVDDGIGNDDDDAADGGDGLNGDVKGAEHAGPEEAVSSWEDRPIRPAQTIPGPYDANVQGVTNDALRTADIIATDAGEGDDSTLPSQVELSWDDRPIEPAQSRLIPGEPADNDMAGVVKVAVDVGAIDAYSVDGAQPWDERPIRPARTWSDEENVIDDSLAHDGTTESATRCEVEENAEESVEPTHVEHTLPVRPVQGTYNEVTNGISDTTAADLDTKVECVAVDGTNTSSAQNAEDAEFVNGSQSWDDRPIQPASTVHDETDECTADYTASPSEPTPTELVQAACSQDERPIRPAPTCYDRVDNLRDGNNGDTHVLPHEVSISDSSPQNQAEMGHSSTLDESPVKFSDTGLSKMQGLVPHSMHPLQTFERRFAESETLSGSESEIAFLGGLEDVFDPVDELVPSGIQDEGIRESGDSNQGALLLTVMNNEPDEITEERVPYTSSNMGFRSPCRPSQENSQTEDTGQFDGIFFLQEFGIRKYCEHKQALFDPLDPLSQAVYESNQDDSDLVFEALVGDDPLGDDWFDDVSSRGIHSHSVSKVVVVADRHLRLEPMTTYDLIMGNASPEDILEAELSEDDDGDFDLVTSFKYPVPRRRVVDPSRGSSSFRRVPSAPTGLEAKTTSSLLRSASESRIEADASHSASRQPSPPSRHTSVNSPVASVAKATTPPKSVLSRGSPDQPKLPTPIRSRLTQRKSIASPSGIVKPPSSLVRPRSFVQSSSGLAPPSEVSTSSNPVAPNDSVSPSRPTRSLLPRRSFTSTSSLSKAAGASGSTRSSITGSIPKPAEVSSGLQAARKTFGFRPSSPMTKKM